MISHKYKCIFIHIPKCAGSSVFRYFNPEAKVNWKVPDYDVLYGWCPKRRIHLQHATSKQLIETELITEEQWSSYLKFTIVRNPWDRAYSDYLWMQRDTGINDTFDNFLNKEGKFEKVLRDSTIKKYRGDHLLKQVDFFDKEGKYKLDKLLRFENFKNDFSKLIKEINVDRDFNKIHEKKSTKRYEHYSLFYTKSKQLLVEKKYKDDINSLGYEFNNKKKGLYKIKDLL